MQSYCPNRKRSNLITQLAQTVVMAVLIGTAFLDIGTSQRSIAKRGPVIFFCCVNMGE